MERQTLLDIRRDLEALAIEFWHEVDFNWGREAHTYYTEDAEFTTSVRPRRGRDAIRDFYSSREQRGPRTSIHIVANFRVIPESPDVVDTQYIMSLHAADGEGVLPSRPAIMIADVRERAVRQPQGGWLYSARVIRALFRDETPTTG